MGEEEEEEKEEKEEYNEIRPQDDCSLARCCGKGGEGREEEGD